MPERLHVALHRQHGFELVVGEKQRVAARKKDVTHFRMFLEILEGRLEQLRTFEREYRTRLKTYLESQLEELGQRGSAAPVDSSANNEGGFNQFNRGNN